MQAILKDSTTWSTKWTTTIPVKPIGEVTDNGYLTFLITAANAWGGSTPVDALTVNRKFVGLAKFKDALTSTVANVDNLNGISINYLPINNSAAQVNSSNSTKYL